MTEQEWANYSPEDQERLTVMKGLVYEIQQELSLRDIRIKALQDALRSVLVAYSDIPLPIELRGRLRAILEDSEK